MRKASKFAVIVMSAALGFVSVSLSGAKDQDAAGDLEGWSSDFSAEKPDLTSTGKNPYFVLEPGYQLILEDDDELLTISVLHETRVVDGVETRVVEERETKNGKPVEVSRNFFAISQRTNNVYYFGEEVDDYKDGKIVGHPGAWLSGEKGARFGLVMPGLPLLKARFYNEVAPKVAMDRAEIVSTGATFKTLAGEFKNCLKIEETTPLEPKTKESKLYAPGIGLIQDGSLKLVKYGMASATDGKPTPATVAAAASKKEDDGDDEDDDDDEKESKGDKKEEHEVKIKFTEAPAAVQKTLQREAFGATIAEVDKETEDGKTIYEADVKIDGRNYEIKVAADGALVSKEIDEKESEVAIQLADCPAPALKTLQREALGAKIEKVDKVVRDGHTLYESDVKIDGKNYEIIVTADGVLLSKEIDEGEDE